MQSTLLPSQHILHNPHKDDARLLASLTPPHGPPMGTHYTDAAAAEQARAHWEYCTMVEQPIQGP